MWSRRLLVAGAVAVLVGGVLVYSLIQVRVYTAEAVVDVDFQQALRADEAPESFLREITTAVDNAELWRAASREAGWTDDADELRQQLDVEPFVEQNGETVLLIRFSASTSEFPTSTAEDSARIANIYARLFVERIQQLGDGQLAGVTVSADAVLASEAVPPERSSGSSLILYAILATVGGVLIGGVGALLLDSRARRWRGVRDAELTLRAPVIGVIPDFTSGEEETGSEA